MRRSSLSNDEILNNNGRNIDELIYKFDTKSDKHRLQQLFSTPIPQLQRELEMYYDREQNRGITTEDVQRELLRRLILKQNTDSLLSLTDSEFCSDDQSRFDSDGGVAVGSGRGQFHRRHVEDDASIVGKEQVAYSLSRVGRLLDMLSRLPWPRMSFTALGICFLGAIFISPRACVQNILFPAFRLVFGTLYPAYASYKAVRTKNVKEYVKWMMYWIVYAFFTCIETFTDIFLSWFPFYYEVKVLVVLWLLSPATKGSSVLYRKFVHPMLTKREQEIDDYLNQAKERGYTAVIQLGSKGVNYATNVIMQTALKGGGNLVQTIRRSYSLSDLSEPDVHRTQDEIDEITRPQQQGRIIRQRNPNPVTRSSSGTRHSTGMYFSEIDVAPKAPIDNLNYNIRSSEDISSGYSSAEPVSGGLSRTSSMTSANKLRFRAKRAEDDNFSENDENEYLNSLSSQYPQNFYNPKNPLLETPFTAYPIQSSNSDNPKLIRPIPKLLNKDLIKDWKDEIFFENEEYFQRKSIPNIEKDINVPPDMREKYEMFCQWLENNKEINDENIELANKNIKKQFSDDDFKDTISVNSEEGLEKFIDIDNSNDKIEMKIEDKPNNLPKIEETINNLNPLIHENEIIVPEIISEIPEQMQENIKTEELKDNNHELLVKNFDLSDKNEMDIKNVNTENSEIKSFKFEPFAKVIVQNNTGDDSDFSAESKENKKSDSPSPRKEHDYEEINFANSSLPENKRPVFHSKGKAPVPPTPLIYPKLASTQSIIRPKTPPPCSISPSPNFTPPTAAHLYESHVAKSRSPSPKPEPAKSKTSKKSLFRSYLPSIFRSESPKPIQIKSDDDSHRETEI